MIIALCRLKNALNNFILGWSVWCQFCCLIQHIFFGNLNCFRRYSGLLRRLQWWALEWLQLWSINFGCTKLEWLLPKSDQFIHNLIFAWIGGFFFSKFPSIIKVSQFQNVLLALSFRPKYQRNFFKDFCPNF